MSTNVNYRANVTQGKDVDFDTLVEKTFEFLDTKVSRLVMGNDACVNFFVKEGSDQPTVVEIQQHMNNIVTLTIALDIGDVVAVKAPQSYNFNHPVKFFDAVTYLQCKGQGQILEQVFSTKGLVPATKWYATVQMTRGKCLVARAASSNKDFIKFLIGSALMTTHYANDMMEILIVDRRAVASGRIAQGMFFDSNVYCVKEDPLGYYCESVSYNQEIKGNEGIYFRHNYRKNEIQFFHGDVDKVHEILQWVEEKCHNEYPVNKFFIHRYAGNGKYRNDPTIRYRVCPVLGNKSLD